MRIRRSSLWLAAPAALALFALPGCDCSGGMGDDDAGVSRHDAGRRRDAGMMQMTDGGGERDAGDCGGTCTELQYCDDGVCRDYPACAADGSCPNEGDVCINRRCVPGDSDLDGDGSPLSEDCDDLNPDRFPGNPEICSPIDEDCDEVIDNGDPAALCEFYPGGGVCENSSCGCPAGTFDLDRSVPGCECVAAPAIDQGLDCASAVDLGSLTDDAQSMQITGNVLPDDRETWYRFRGVDGADTSCDNYHVRVQMLANPDDTFEMMVFRGGCDAAQCGDQAYADYSWATDFRQTIGGRLTGQCPCDAPGGAFPPLNVSTCTDDSADYYVRVRRRPGSTLSCASFTIEVSNGLYDTP